jgi:hypothetical protein
VNFWIQTGHPALRDVDVVADTMADAITLLYPLDTDHLILSWNLVPIALTYCEDVQVLVDDVVVLLERLRDPATESARVYWGSSTFRAEWWLRCDGGNLVVDSRWDGTNGNYESLLNDRARLTVDAGHFHREWLKVLRRLVEDIAAKSVALDNADMLLRARALLVAAESPAADVLPGTDTGAPRRASPSPQAANPPSNSRSPPPRPPCVEVATCATAVHVRDSKDPEGPALSFTADAWTAFVGWAGDLGVTPR